MRLKTIGTLTAALWMSALSSFAITSVSGGGYWGDTNTWVGRVIPTINDPVTINGTVTGGGGTILGLTISSGATLDSFFLGSYS